MARCVCCSVGLLCVWVVTVFGADRPQEPTPPVPIRQVRHPLPTPTAIDLPARDATPLPPAVPDEPAPLTPSQHLRHAADHIEAAAVGPVAEELCAQAAQLRETADRLDRERAERLAELKEQLHEIQSEIRKLEQQLPTSDQIKVSIKFLEFDPAQVEHLGLTIHEAADPETDVMETILSSLKKGSLRTLISGNAAACLVESLRNECAAKVVAEPQIITVSGRPASIHSGGEFPILVPNANGAPSVEWREFGVRAEVMPRILDSGRLRLEVAPEISERDFSNCVTVAGLKVPGLRSRRLNTRVEMDFGQTLVIGAISSHVDGGNRPIVALPVPGKDRHFKAISHEDKPERKSLLVLVTPERVSAADE